MRDAPKSSAKSRKTGKKSASTKRQRAASPAARRGSSRQSATAKARKRRGPVLPKLMVAFGAILVLLSGGSLVGINVLVSRYEAAIPQEDMLGDALVTGATTKVPEGPLNMLMVGVDSRPGQPMSQARADTIIILHISADRQQAYLLSVPRDLMVQVKKFPKSGFGGGRAKMTEAFYHGAQGNGGVAGGMELLALTIKETLGVSFNAAAIINFQSFEKVIDALGGVDLCFDQKVVSKHLVMGAKGPVNVENKDNPEQFGRPIVYEAGTCRRLKSWEALDFSRQRYGLRNGDYDRQRHQQQLIKAIAKEATSKSIATNPAKLDGVIKAAGQAFVLDTGNVPMVDFVFELKGLSPDKMVTVKTNAGQVTSTQVDGISYEKLSPESEQMFESLRSNTLDAFVLQHPEFTSQ